VKATAGFLPLSRNNDPRAYATLEAADAQWDAFNAKLDAWAAGNDATSARVNSDADATYASGRKTTIALLILATLIAVAVAFTLARSIGRGLRSMVTAANGCPPATSTRRSTSARATRSVTWPARSSR